MQLKWWTQRSLCDLKKGLVYRKKASSLVYMYSRIVILQVSRCDRKKILIVWHEYFFSQSLGGFELLEYRFSYFFLRLVSFHSNYVVQCRGYFPSAPSFSLPVEIGRFRTCYSIAFGILNSFVRRIMYFELINLTWNNACTESRVPYFY